MNDNKNNIIKKQKANFTEQNDYIMDVYIIYDP